MNNYKFPSCCTAQILTGFGRGVNVSYSASKTPTKEELQQKLQYLKTMGYGIVIAITNSDQKKGRRLLKAEGFKTSKAASSKIHPETKTYIHYLNVQEWNQSGN